MILYVFIVRTSDGLPLSASTDFNHEINANIKENKKYVKKVANIAPQLPERCVLPLDSYTVYMLTCLGVSYLALVEYRYPAVLAFSFLNELMKEFVQKYDQSKTNSAKRPFHFIEFDSFIHKTRQMYNSPQKIATRVNVQNLEAELALRPPFRLTVELNVGRLGVGSHTKLEPLSLYCWVALVFASMIILLGVIRGFVALHVSSVEVYGGTSPWHGVMYLIEAGLRVCQTYLLVYHTRFRMMKSWLCSSFLLLLIFILWELRNPSQHIVFVLSTVFTLICTMMRKTKDKLPNQEV